MKTRTLLLFFFMSLTRGVSADVTWPNTFSQEWVVTIGTKVTSADDVVDGQYYVLYNPRNGYYMFENASNKLLLTGGYKSGTLTGTTNTNSIFKLISNGDGTYQIQSATGRYLPAPTANGNISTSETAGNYALNFQPSGSIYPRCTNAGNTYGLDHTSNGVYAYTTVNFNAGGAQEYHLYNVTLTATEAPTSTDDISTGWYRVKCIASTGSYTGYLKNVSPETAYSGVTYPIGIQSTPTDISSADATYYFYFTKSTYGHYIQITNGHYIDRDEPKAITGASSCKILKDANGFYFQSNSSASKYFVPYKISDIPSLGGSTQSWAANVRYALYKVTPNNEGLTPWQVTLSDVEDVSCSTTGISGLTTVYNNGYFFLPTGTTPASSDFTATISGNSVSPTLAINTTEHTISVSVPVLTINSPQAEATFTWNGESKTGKTVTFTYTGQDITNSNITVSYAGNDFTNPTLSQNSWDGLANTTITCTMTPAFFSTNYGDKWVRIYSTKESSLVVDLAQVSNGAKTKMQSRDFFSQKQLWCLVGDASSFTLYNKAAGENYVLASGSASPGQNTTISLQPSATAANAAWTLGDQFSAIDAPGYSIYVNGANGDYGMHGWQSGNEVKYWGAASGGSHFLIEDASGEVTLDLAGLDPASMTVYTQNIAVLPSTIAGSSYETLLTKDNYATRTAYVPNNTELTFGTPKMFMNYGFTGYDGNNQTKTVTATTTPQTVTATFSVARPDARYLWEPLRQDNTDYYRIPAIVTAKNGDIIAINDRRFNNASDIGNDHHIDLIGVASSDNGQTWSNEFMIMDGDNGGEKGYGDAAVVADRESNKILVMACGGNVTYQAGTTENHQSIDRVVLTKDGSTWSASGISVVTNQFYAGDLASCPAMFIGSGSITQSSIIKKGDYYRIYCAVLARTMGNYVLYSDDFGTTWTYLGSDSSAANGDEAKVSELPDGSVLLSSRKSYGRYFNVWTWSDDTYTSGSWGTAVASNNQTGGISFGNNSTNGDIRMIPAIKKATGEMVTLAMQSIPTGNGRSNVSIYYKEVSPTTYTPTIIAQNWSNAFEVTPYQSAYSAFNQQPDGRIAFFMEEAPKAITEAKVGYYMCYVPLTLDEITNNQYTGIASTYPVKLNAIGGKSYATLYLPFDVKTVDGTKAYYIASASNGFAQLTELTDGEIAAGTAVLLVNETASNATFNVTSGLTQQVSESNNLLKGTLTSMSLDLGGTTPYYALGKKEINGVETIGFYKFDNNGTTTITLGANKAYLDTTAPANTVKGFVFDFDDDATSIKTIDNGQQTTEGVIYNLSGQRLSKPVNGINIVNGKKVLY